VDVRGEMAGDEGRERDSVMAWDSVEGVAVSVRKETDAGRMRE
jgi:hypothetical protein